MCKLLPTENLFIEYLRAERHDDTVKEMYFIIKLVHNQNDKIFDQAKRDEIQGIIHKDGFKIFNSEAMQANALSIPYRYVLKIK